MSGQIKYFKLEENIFKYIGKIGYVAVFILLGIVLMSIIDFILFCFVDNYYISKFILTGEMNVSTWLKTLYISYNYPYIKIILFGSVFLFSGIYRCKVLTKVFSK